MPDTVNVSEGSLSLSEIDKMTIIQLNDELVKREKSDAGNKAVLKFRLMTLVGENENEPDQHSSEEETEQITNRGTENTDNSSVSNKDSVGNYYQCKSSGQRLTFRDAEESIEKYNGDSRVPVKKWIESVEEIGAVADWSNHELLLFGKRMLEGAAKKYMQSQKAVLTWENFKAKIVSEFRQVVNSKNVHEQLRGRKKLINESCREYLYEMMAIASQIDLEDDALIEYIVDGIEDNSVNKYILRGATNIDELKRKFEEYEKVKKRNKHSDITTRLNIQRRQQQNIPPTRNKPARCYNCGAVGHESKVCPNSGQGPKCFKCQTYGHMSKECVKANTRGDVLKVVYHNEKVIPVKIGNLSIEALVDTGSVVNLIREDIAEKCGLSEGEKTNRTFQGLGGYVIKPTMVVNDVNIEINNENYITAVYVIPSQLLTVPILLGIQLLEQAELLITSTEIKFKKLTEKMEKENENDEVKQLMMVYTEKEIVDICPRFEKEVAEIIKNYEPVKDVVTPIETKIILTDETPIYQRPRRLAPLEKKVLDKQIEEWLKDGVIVESVSEFSSPVVIVRKKNGKHRVCVDYRKLNQKVMKDRYPMPVIEEQLSKLSNARVFSTIDLENGFFHVPVALESRKYTAFVTPDNQYEFVKTPFGLCNSPASFGRFINHVFRNLIRDGVVINYVDDLIIPSEDEKQGIQKLKLVLGVAAQNGLKIKWEKCQFLKKEVEYLGHIVNHGEVKPSPMKIKAVASFPTPITTKQIQSFLGLSGYFRKFVPEYAKVAKPLTELLKKNEEFRFGIKEEVAFKTLKEILTTEPVLRIYCPDAITELHTDASIDGLAAVLLQKKEVEQRLHPVYYTSRTTSSAEKQYHSYELEVLAIVTALKKFRVYLLGIKFKIVTDCAAFQRTVGKRDVPSRSARWIFMMEEFDYCIEHRSSERLKHVDAMSRLPVCIVRDTLTELLKLNQNKDEHVVALKELAGKEGYRDYEVENGVLMKFVNGKHLIVVPNVMQKDIIRRVHDDGHFAVKKMEEIIQRDYYIPNLVKKLQNHLQCCIKCIMCERKRGKKEGRLHPIPKGESPLETYHIDHVGPMSATCKNYKYLLVIVDAFSKFTWLYPVKTTNTKEVIDRLELQSKTFGDPGRIVSDRGTAFTSNEFRDYCEQRNIEHRTITTGVPRGNGQVERENQIIIYVLSKLCHDNPTKWYQYVDRVQRCVNSTYQNSIGFSPQEVLIGTKMKNKEDNNILEILQQERVIQFQEGREELRRAACDNIFKVQQEQRKQYNRKRKKATEFKTGDQVAIKRTQFGVGLKLKNKYLGPYEVIKSYGKERYEVKKIGHGEGPLVTTSSADFMKPWRMESSETDD